jgi:hypothetical protein
VGAMAGQGMWGFALIGWLRGCCWCSALFVPVFFLFFSSPFFLSSFFFFALLWRLVYKALGGVLRYLFDEELCCKVTMTMTTMMTERHFFPACCLSLGAVVA